MLASQLVTQEIYFPQSKVPGAQPAQAGMGRGGPSPSYPSQLQPPLPAQGLYQKIL